MHLAFFRACMDYCSFRAYIEIYTDTVKNALPLLGAFCTSASPSAAMKGHT